MIRILLLFSVMISVNLSFAQNDRIKFTYDSAGNQIRRYICSNCAARNATDDDYKNEGTITENDLIKDEEFNQISYYPNPVREELYVKWVNTAENHVTAIEIYSMSGQSINIIKGLEKTEIATIKFSTYPQGVYNLILLYNSGERKILKIVKN